MRDALPANTIICNGAGNFSGWWHRYWHYGPLPTQLAPTSGTMGYGLPAAVAAALRFKDRPVVCVAGDGDFLMGVTALWTAAHYRIPLLVVVANNRSFFNDELHQERVARMRNRPVENRWVGQRISEPDIDLAGMARAQGAQGFGPVNAITDLAPTLTKAIASVEAGAVAVVDVRVELVDGSFHDVDSSEMAFKIAGSMAFKNAMQKAKPKILEPIMAVEVVTPEEYLGDVMGDLNSRRGRVEGLEPRGNAQAIRARVPLATMFGYATDLRSTTQGRATFTMQFDRYEDAPQSIAGEIVSEAQGS